MGTLCRDPWNGTEIVCRVRTREQAAPQSQAFIFRSAVVTYRQIKVKLSYENPCLLMQDITG